MKMTLTSKGILPCSVKCVCCGKAAKPGQWVMFHKHKELNVVMHRACVVDMIEEVDCDAIDSSIAEEYNNIRLSYRMESAV